jgi:rare lipoprotein A
MRVRPEGPQATGPTSLWILVSAGVLSAATAAGFFAFFTVNVQADAPLARPASTLPPTAKWAERTPNSLAPTRPKTKPDLLHGFATWYGSVLDGHRTASGERFDMYAMTACHPTLPFGTLVRVTNLVNKSAVVVRINDRGELAKGRVIDLSYAAAEQLKMTKRGLAPVAIEVISMGRSRRNH